MTSLNPPVILSSLHHILGRRIYDAHFIGVRPERWQVQGHQLGSGGSLGRSLCCVILCFLLLWPWYPSFAVGCEGIRVG